MPLQDIGPGKQEASTVQVPKDEEEWNDFVTKYSRGEFANNHFASDSRSVSRLADTLSGSIDSGAEAGPSSLSLHSSRIQTPDPNNLGEMTTSPPPNDTRRPSLTVEDSPEEESDTHPYTSASGPANQDPDIPNIISPSEERTNPLITMAWNPAAREERPVLSADNVRRLQDRGVEENGLQGRGGGGGGGNKSRRRTKVELASMGRQDSSPSSDEDQHRSARGSRASVRPRSIRSRNSRYSFRGNHKEELAASLLDSGTNTASSLSHVDLNYDITRERARVREFFAVNGYMPAPKQTPEAMRRRLRVIRRLGLEDTKGKDHGNLDRFTRLAVSMFKTRMAMLTIVGKDKMTYLSEVGVDRKFNELDLSFCAHTIIGGEQCMVIPDASADWRFANNPLVDQGRGLYQFYVGAPLRVGNDAKSAVIGSLCLVDDKPRQFSEHERGILFDLAQCVVSELELDYVQRSAVESAKLHQISVDFLRRSLKHRPNERAGFSRNTDTTTSKSTERKRKEGADNNQSDDEVDIYDEACSEIRLALDAYAVAVVDLSQFHLFYPAFHNSSSGGSRTAGSVSRGGSAGQTTITGGTSTASLDEADAYSKPSNRKHARKTYAITDPTAPSRTPQVLFIPNVQRSAGAGKAAKYVDADAEDGVNRDELAVLGYSCGSDGFAFNFAGSTAARKIIADFIASNVKTRKAWYTRDDSEGIAQSITHLMPPGTETSMALPIFGFDGQVAFAVVACWTDPLFTYPMGSLEFVETIAGCLLAAVLKERLHQAERAQLNFASAASHELRTPLHQINAAASLLRASLQPVLTSPTSSPKLGGSSAWSAESRSDASMQLDVIETNGLALGQILGNIIDSLDIGRSIQAVEGGGKPVIAPSSTLSSLKESSSAGGPKAPSMGKNPTSPGSPAPAPAQPELTDFGLILEDVVLDGMNLEHRMRSLVGQDGIDKVEVILEVLPRSRGGWMVKDAPGPLLRALGKILQSSFKSTDSGYIHITVQDVSRTVVLPAGYDNSMRLATVSIDIKDTGRGVSADVLDRAMAQGIGGKDAFTPNSGLSLNLAQRMIELLGGKFAIASTQGKGTIVHVEVELHLLNVDNSSDNDELNREADQGDTLSDSGAAVVGANESDHHSRIRQDGLFIVGFDVKHTAIRRVGKSLIRQLKLTFCRVVSEIRYASLIVAPGGPHRVSSTKLAQLVASARPGAQVILLDPKTFSAPGSLGLGRAHDSANDDEQSNSASSYDGATLPITRLSRPLRPSIMNFIMTPPNTPPPKKEMYISEVVGGNDARAESTGEHRPVMLGHSNSTDTARPRSPGRDQRDNAHYSRSKAQPGVEHTVEVVDYAYQSGSASDGGAASHQPPAGSSRNRNEHEQKEKDAQGGHSHGRPSLKSSHVSDPLPQHDSGEEEQRRHRHRDREGSESQVVSAASSEIDMMTTDESSITSYSQSHGWGEGDHQRRPGLREAQSAPGGQKSEDDVIRLLVVEDNMINRRILTTMIKRTGFKYAEAVDGQDAIHQFTSFRPHLILLDLNMPIKDGFTAAAEIRQIEHNLGWQSCYIVAVTALSGDHHKRRGMLECGIDEWRTKPVSMGSLREDLKKWVKGLWEAGDQDHDKVGGVVQEEGVEEAREDEDVKQSGQGEGVAKEES